MSRSSGFRAFVFAMLCAGGFLFALPFVWLVVTSLKPIEQTMSLPPSWIPRSHHALIHGERVEVILERRLSAAGAVVRIAAGPREGERLWLDESQIDRAAGLGRLVRFESGRAVEERWRVTIETEGAVGDWLVRESFDTTARTREARWTVAEPDAIETEVRPRWENYPRALASMGGAQLLDAERGTTASEAGGPGFGTYVFNTLWVCGLGVVGAVLSNAIVAYGFAKLQWPGRDWVFAVTLATMMVPFPVLMVPVYEVFRNLGWIGTLLPLWAPSFFGSAFNIFLMRQFFRTIPDELCEAARIDGCSEWRIFWTIVMPLSKPVLAVVALFHFLHAWNDFLGPLLFLTRKETFTLALALQTFQSQHGGTQWHYLMAASVVVTLPVVILFFLTQRTFIQGIATTGLKG